MSNGHKIPTIARIAFHMVPERHTEFEVVYEQKLAPILRQHGFVPLSARSPLWKREDLQRPMVAEAFVRRFRLRGPAQFFKKWQALFSDPTWGNVMQNLRAQFEITVGLTPFTLVPMQLEVTPVGPGQTTPAGPGRGHFRTYDGVDGLVNNMVWSIFQDREGRLWFCTDGGVSLYDGQSWTTFTTKDGLAHNQVFTMVQDGEGALWFGTRDGVSQYDSQTWTTYTTKDGLANNRVWSIVQDREDNLWFGTWDGVSRYDGQTWMTYTTKDGLANNRVWSIVQDREDNLWFGTESGVSRYNGQTWTTYTTKDGLAGNSVLSIVQDREGHIWFGTQSGGASRFDGQVFTSFTEADSLGQDWVRSIVQDREGYLWFGTMGGGAMGGGATRYDGRTWKTFTREDGLPNYLRSVLQDREGALWFGGNESGITRYDGQSFTGFGIPDGGPEDMFSMVQDQEGCLWVGTGGDGVRRYDGKAWTSLTTKDGLALDDVRAVLQDREGDLWFGTFGGGVSRYRKGMFETFTEQDGLASNTVWSIYQDRDGALWFGTNGGVSRFDPSASPRTGAHTWTTFTIRDGLAHDVVYAIFQDRDGVLWFGTGGGISRYDGRVFQTLTQEDGLVGNQVYAIFQDVEGTMWFGTSSGVTRYCKPPASPPPAFVDAVTADRRYERVSDLSIPSTVGLTGFEFHGISLKTRPEAMVYRYRLKGYENVWRTTRTRRVEYENLPLGDYTFEVVAVDRDLVYSEAPATVALHVARDVRDEQIDELERRVRERTWELEAANRQIQEASERKSAFLASMSHELRTPMNAIKGFTNLVLRRGKDAPWERNRENLEKVTQASDHLLAMINDLLDLSKIEAGRMDVNAATFDVKHLIATCVSTVSPLVKEGVKLSYEIADGVGEAHTDEARVRQMVINLLSNAIKFTDAGEVKVTAKVNGQQMLEIAVSDTGKGIPADELPTIFDEYRQVKGSESSVQKGTGLGLSITKKFAELLGGTISVESMEGKGSTFTVRVPAKYQADKKA